MILSAGIIPLRWYQGKWQYLLMRSYNYWDFPKGLVEAEEEPLLAALRELKEETGISEATLPWGEQFIETEPYARNKKARYYLGKIPSDQKITISANSEGIYEHHEYRWVDATEASALLNERVKKVLNWASAQVSGPL